MPTSTFIKNLDKDQLKKVSKALVQELAIKIALGVVATVAVTLISGVIMSKITPIDELSE